MPNAGSRKFWEHLSRYPETPLNFIIYRLTYHDDAQWALFMAHFKRVTNAHLAKYYDPDLIPHVAWDVHEDPGMQDAPSSKVREHLRTRLETLTTVQVLQGERYESKGECPLSLSFPRNIACVAVGQFELDRILMDVDRTDDVIESRVSERGFVTLVSLFEEDEPVLVMLSAVFPDAYTMITICGWDRFPTFDIWSG